MIRRSEVFKALFRLSISWSNLRLTILVRRSKVSLNFWPPEKCNFWSPDCSFELLKIETFDLLKFDLMIIPPLFLTFNLLVVLVTSDRKLSVSVSVSAEISVSVSVSFNLSVSAEISVQNWTENQNLFIYFYLL